ncbi:MAG: deoxyguanosinetriphosphate triphosphohydrolase [Eubacterium sp.]
MLLREDLEKREYDTLSDRASKAAETKGRRYHEEKDPVRTDFMRDRDRIIHSKAFRRLMHKTQVFLGSEKDHYRTRLTHTLEVSQIARTISRALMLNEDLTEAIALGHDLGHTPYGHNGEYILNEIHEGGFRHNEQSLRVVDFLESSPSKPGIRGMNLTYEVRDGILNHSGKGFPSTLEGQVVRLSDRIAYINHDIDDAIRSGVISDADLPRGPIALFGGTHSKRIGNMVMNAVRYSEGRDTVSMEPEYMENMNELREFMFKRVYNSPLVKKEADLKKVDTVIRSLYQYFLEHPEEIPETEAELIRQDGVRTVVKDYIAGMTDRYADRTYERIFGRGTPTDNSDR